MALYTGKGDKGTTKLFDTAKGVRVTKASPIFEALGMLDELNSVVGWCKVEARSQSMALGKKHISDMLHDVQDHLFTAQAEVAGTDKKVLMKAVRQVEKYIAQVEEAIPPITSFVVPGGNELSSRLDVARAVSRRVERRVITVVESGERKVSKSTLAYLNRLSSLLYALARFANHAGGVLETKPQYRG
jgi:cob(I)alamin adenosyltransferase